MSTSPPSLTREPLLWPRSIETAEALVGAALAAHKAGTLADWLRQRPRAARWAARRWLAVVSGAAGDRLDPATADASALGLLLHWAIQQTRPDNAPAGAAVDRAAWLQQTSWRPMLALACHFGFEPVPDFREQYRRRPDESTADNLCGLWSVGPSTFYRYLDKGKRQLVERLLFEPMTGVRRISLRRFVVDRLGAAADDPAARRDWHERQGRAALARRDAAAALWHFLEAAQFGRFTEAVARFRGELARDAEADALLDAALQAAPTPRLKVDVLLARSVLHRTASEDERERLCYEQAMRLANAASDDLMLGLVYGALGRFHETRDTDRAFAYFEESCEFLRRCNLDGASPDAGRIHAEYLGALTKLAWFCVLRNDPRSRAILDSAELLRDKPGVGDTLLAMLEQTWGEYWRRAGDLRRALDRKHRALTIYERLGDRQQMLQGYSNLIDLYGETREFAKAIEYGDRLLAEAERSTVDPYVLAGALLNLGAVHYWLEDFDAALATYGRSLQLATDAHLPVLANRARYNLAEAHFKRFQLRGDPADERAGDEHVAAGLRAKASETDLREATRSLKMEMLGPDRADALERLVPEEHAAHPEEMADVQRSRKVLAVPAPAEAHVQARLNIARAYLAISTKEREAALALIDKHGLGDRFAGAFEALKTTFDRELTREQRLAAQWKQAAADLLGDERRASVLAHVLREGSINKSGYAEVCGVGAATASKHLVTLAERGLLQQTGKGPSTRYRLPTT